MKKTWTTPELTVYGSVEELTQKRIFDFEDGVIFGTSDDDDDDARNGSL